MYSSGACWVSALPAFAFFSQPRLGALEAQQVELRRVVDAHQDTLDANLDHRVSHNSGVRSLPLSHSPFSLQWFIKKDFECVVSIYVALS